MAQFKIYGHAQFLEGRTAALSSAIHQAAVEGLGLPVSKRFHRFIPLAEGYFLTPDDRSKQYLIIDACCFKADLRRLRRRFIRRFLWRWRGLA